jgi:acyl carrier protein
MTPARPRLFDGFRAFSAGTNARRAKLHRPIVTRDQIIEGLRDLLRQQKQIKLSLEAIHEDTRLDQIGFDSLTILDFIYDIENRFQVPLELTELVNLRLVSDVIDHLEAKLRG